MSTGPQRRAEFSAILLAMAQFDVLPAALVEAAGGGEGVVQHHELVAWLIVSLQNMIDSVTTPSAEEPRLSLDELMAVGEWPPLILASVVLGAEEARLAELRDLAGL